MNIAFLFNSNHPKFDGIYGDPIRDAILRKGVLQKTSRRMRVLVGDEVGHFQGSREHLQRAQSYFVDEQGKELAAAFALGFRLVDERIDELEREQEEAPKGPQIAAPRTSAVVETPSSIFDDIDDV